MGMMGTDLSRMRDLSQLWPQFQSILQLKLLGHVQTGVWFVDTAVVIAAMYLLGVLFRAVSGAQPYLMRATEPAFWWRVLLRIFAKLFGWTAWGRGVRNYLETVETHTRLIPTVTERFAMNDLYEPALNLCSELVEQYRNQNKANGKEADTLAELSVVKGSEALRCVPCSGLPQKFIFDGVEFEFRQTAPKITIYGDRERSRVNHTISLSCKTPRNYEGDPFVRLVAEAKRREEEIRKNATWKQTVYKNNAAGEWEEIDKPHPRRLESVVLRTGLRETIVKDLEEFAAHEGFYLEVGMPFTRRYLFHGAPRTGKTSMLRALAAHNRRHIHFLSFREIDSDETLFKLLGPKGLDHRSTVIILEDVDCATDAVLSRSEKKSATTTTAAATALSNGPHPGSPTKGLSEEATDSLHDKKPKGTGPTLSGILNVLDGVIATPGQVMIATTNHPDRLDPAFVAPGRFHRKFEFGLADRDQFERLYVHMFKVALDPAVVQAFVPNVLSPADVTNEFLMKLDNPAEAAATVATKSQTVFAQQAAAAVPPTADGKPSSPSSESTNEETRALVLPAETH